jgi:hypothetical protein
LPCTFKKYVWIPSLPSKTQITITRLHSITFWKTAIVL